MNTKGPMPPLSTPWTVSTRHTQSFSPQHAATKKARLLLWRDIYVHRGTLSPFPLMHKYKAKQP